jgi:hypothetical protein
MDLHRNVNTSLHTRPTSIDRQIMLHHPTLRVDPHLSTRIVLRDTPTAITNIITILLELYIILRLLSYPFSLLCPSLNKTRALSVPSCIQSTNSQRLRNTRRTMRVIETLSE